MLVTALSCVVSRNKRVLGSRVVHHFNHLRVARAVAAVIRHRPRAGHSVLVGAATFIDGLLEVHRHILAVVARSQHRSVRVRAVHRHVTWQFFIEGWCRGVNNRDGLGISRAVATLVRCRERTGHNVRLGTCARSCICNQRDGHFTAVVRGRGVIERVLVAALSRVVGRDGQLGSRRVLNRDGLGQRRAVVAIVGRSERALDRVALWAVTLDDFRHQLNGHVAVAVVGGRSIVVGDFLIALDGVIRGNRQFRSRRVHEAQELLKRGDVFAFVCHRVCTHVHAHGLNTSTRHWRVFEGDGHVTAVVRRLDVDVLVGVLRALDLDFDVA